MDPALVKAFAEEYIAEHKRYIDEEIEKKEILKALDITHWNRTAAAKKLGMTFRSLRYRLKKLELDR